jgi:predicted ATPase
MAAYYKLVQLGALDADDTQASCLNLLHGLWEDFGNHRRGSKEFEIARAVWQIEHAAWRAEVDRLQQEAAAKSVVSKDAAKEPSGDVHPVEFPVEPEEPQRPRLASYGYYLWGNVGSGKSLVMDLFAECCESEADDRHKSVRRVHFHAFMLHVQQELHRLRRSGLSKTTRDVAHLIA